MSYQDRAFRIQELQQLIATAKKRIVNKSLSSSKCWSVISSANAELRELRASF